MGTNATAVNKDYSDPINHRPNELCLFLFPPSPLRCRLVINGFIFNFLFTVYSRVEHIPRYLLQFYRYISGDLRQREAAPAEEILPTKNWKKKKKSCNIWNRHIRGGKKMCRSSLHV